MPYLKHGVYWMKITHGGQTVMTSTGVKNKKAAIAIEQAKRTALRLGEVGIFELKDAPTLKEFQTAFENHIRPHVKPRTMQFYCDYMKPLIAFEKIANAKLPQITPERIGEFTQHRLAEGVARVTVNHSLRTLRHALHVARDLNKIAKVPKITLLKGENKREFA